MFRMIAVTCVLAVSQSTCLATDQTGNADKRSDSTTEAKSDANSAGPKAISNGRRGSAASHAVAGKSNSESLLPAAVMDRYRELIRASSRRNRPNPSRLTPKLVSFHRMLAAAEGLSHTQRTRMRHGIEVRLEEMQGQLKRTLRKKPANRRNVAEVSPASLNGPAEMRNAAALIDLIQTTICPDSWDVNGGNGSARFYLPLNVLVIRQTSEVHHQIGGALKN